MLDQQGNGLPPRHPQRQSTLDSSSGPLRTIETDSPCTPSSASSTVQGQSIHYGHSTYRDPRAVLGGGIVHEPIAEGNSASNSVAVSEVFSVANSQRDMTSESSTPPAASAVPDDSATQSAANSECETENGEPFSFKCALVPNCTTGSSARKAVSHFFGRNKSCTLAIPIVIWLYYCRKHYQRVRYRTGSEYAKTQISLVWDQLIKLVEWSEKNRVEKSGPYIKDWSVTLRKRAQEGLHGHIHGGELASSTYPGQQESNLVNGVPAWIIQCRGEGKTEAFIRNIVSRIREELENGTLEEIPEIEFLPNVVDSATGEPTKVRKPNKRKASKTVDSRGAASRPGAQSRKKSKVQIVDQGQINPAGLVRVATAPASSVLPPIDALSPSGSFQSPSYGTQMYGFPEATAGSYYDTRDRHPGGLPVPRTMSAQTSVQSYRPQTGASFPGQWSSHGSEADIGDMYGRQSTPMVASSVQHAQRRPPIPPVYRDGEG